MIPHPLGGEREGAKKMTEFFRSIRGVQLAETIIRELPKLVKELKRLNDLKEKEQGEKENGKV